MSDTNWSLKDRSDIDSDSGTTGDMSTVSARVPMILLFLTRSFKWFEKKNCSSKTVEIFLKQTIT